MKNFSYFLFLSPFFVFSQIQLGNDIYGNIVGNQSYNIVSLSSDGSIIAIGSSENNTNGIDSGQVRVYRNENGNWVQVGNDINGEAAGDLSGESISLSSDGSTVAIGAPENDGKGINSGQVRIYRNENGDWVQIGNDIDGETAGDLSGESISLNSDGSIIAIGAPENDGKGINSGQVRIYRNENGDWVQVGNDINGETVNDHSGSSVSLSSDGSVIAIGASGNDGNGISSGQVRIYRNENGDWVQIGSDIDGEVAGDLSGESISLNSDGSIIAIGASGNDGNGISSGQVRIYRNENGDWVQIGSDIDGEAAGNFSGRSVSLNSDGSVIAIGAGGNDRDFSTSGQVRIYRNENGEWVQIGDVIDREAVFDQSGRSVSLNSDGSIVAIGARSNSVKGVLDGDVIIYKNELGVWKQVGQDINSNNYVGDLSGMSVSLNSDGNVIAIGASGNDGKGINSGQVRVYRNKNGDWVQIGNDIDGEAAGDLSGISVSLNSDGSVVAIGAIRNKDNGINSGQVRIYRNENRDWVQIGNDIDGEAAGDLLGRSVSLNSDGSIVAIGAIGNDYLSGHVRVYRNENEEWQQIGSNINGEAAFDQSGISVSLSSDGSVVAIGAIGNDDNGNSSGQVRIYRNENGEWQQIGNDIDGEAAFDESGRSISLNSDGSIIAIGAIGNDGNGISSGQVRIYRNENEDWVQIGNDIDGETVNDNLGSSVSLSSDGSIIAIGAIGNEENSGQVRIYKNENGEWQQIGNYISGDNSGDNFGFSASLSSDGTIVAIGAPFHDNFGFLNVGQVKVYDLNNVLSTQNNNLENSFTISPNPTKDSFFVQLKETIELQYISVYNNLGKQVLFSKNKEISTKNLSSGLYLVKIVTNIGSNSAKLLVE